MSAQQSLKSFEKKIGRSINLEATLMKMGSTLMDKDQEIKKHQEQFKKLKGLYSKMVDEMDRWKMTSVDLQRDLDLEHIRYLEEQGRRSDLERENKELNESIQGIAEEYMSGCESIDDIRNYIEEKTDEIVELKKWSLSKEMIESTSAESIEEFERDVRDNWKELVELKKCNTYYRCYLDYADPKCDAVPDKEHIDEFAGDDEEVKKSLYKDFCIEE